MTELTELGRIIICVLDGKITGPTLRSEWESRKDPNSACFSDEQLMRMCRDIRTLDKEERQQLAIAILFGVKMDESYGSQVISAIRRAVGKTARYETEGMSSLLTLIYAACSDDRELGDRIFESMLAERDASQK